MAAPLYNSYEEFLNARLMVRVSERYYDSILRAFSLTSAQLQLLQILAEQGGLTQGELAKRTGLVVTTLSRTLKPLLQKGWIIDGQGSDRRQKLVGITATGLQVYQKGVSLVIDWVIGQT